MPIRLPQTSSVVYSAVGLVYGVAEVRRSCGPKDMLFLLPGYDSFSRAFVWMFLWPPTSQSSSRISVNDYGRSVRSVYAHPPKRVGVERIYVPHSVNYVSVCLCLYGTLEILKFLVAAAAAAHIAQTPPANSNCTIPACHWTNRTLVYVCLYAKLYCTAALFISSSV